MYDDLNEVWKKCFRSKLFIDHRANPVIFRDQKLILAPEEEALYLCSPYPMVNTFVVNMEFEEIRLYNFKLGAGSLNNNLVSATAILLLAVQKASLKLNLKNFN